MLICLRRLSTTDSQDDREVKINCEGLTSNWKLKIKCEGLSSNQRHIIAFDTQVG